jgi:hypothetical protein
MDFGGPVWHASTAGTASAKERRRLALSALAGVGAPQLGQWVQERPLAYHVRRRLTPAEQAIVGDVVDLRGTTEAVMRFERMREVVPASLLRCASSELTSGN